MKIVVTEDNPLAQKMLRFHLAKWNLNAEFFSNGKEALECILGAREPALAVLDWMLPAMDGLEILRSIRERKGAPYVYALLLTGKTGVHNVAVGFDAGADDYISKPFDPIELRARIQAGIRVLTLQGELQKTVYRLEDALSRVKRLQGLLPICSYCKRIRDDRNYWHRVERYISEHSDAEFTHGVCPECMHKVIASTSRVQVLSDEEFIIPR